MLFLSVSYGYCMLSNYKNYGKNQHFDDSYLILVVGNIASISNGSFRIIFGIIFDLIGF